ncbi:MAG: hypothetical protein AB1938_24105 [Myxococcota bacterium]
MRAMLDDAAIHEALARTPPRSAQVVMRVGLDGWTLPELASRYGVSAQAGAVLLLRALRDFDAAVARRSTPAPPLPDDEERDAARALAQQLALSARPAGAAAAAGGEGSVPPSAVRLAASPEAPAEASGAEASRGQVSASRASSAPPPGGASAHPASTLQRPEASATGASSGEPPAWPADIPPAPEFGDTPGPSPGGGAAVATWLEYLRALAAHRDAVRQRIAAAEEAAARSPARARETWLRRLAIVAILALSAWFYWKEQQRPPKPPPNIPVRGSRSF